MQGTQSQNTYNTQPVRLPQSPKRVSAVVLAVGLTLLVAAGCGSMPGPPLEVVPSVDLDRYAGKWYEIARYPNWFETDCVGTTAEYTLRDDGKVTVVNTCRAQTLDGDIDRIEGVARVADENTNAKLKVQFFWPFEGDYWIIDLADDYSYAVVGNPGRDFFWILSRTPTLDEAIYQDIVEQMPAWRYDPERLEQVPQPPGGAED